MAGRASWAVLILLMSCGGAPPAEPSVPSASADTEEQSSASEDPSEAAGATEATPPAEGESGEPAAGAADPGATALSEDDLQMVMQQVLDDPDLERYFHLDKPGRVPLKVHGPDLPAKLKLTKGGYDVKLVEKPNKPKSAVLVFTKIERDGDSARLRYEYDIEGIRGSAVVYLKAGRWRLGANRVFEK